MNCISQNMVQRSFVFGNIPKICLNPKFVEHQYKTRKYNSQQYKTSKLNSYVYKNDIINVVKCVLIL